jgi:hypothetical protein
MISWLRVLSCDSLLLILRSKINFFLGPHYGEQIFLQMDKCADNIGHFWRSNTVYGFYSDNSTARVCDLQPYKDHTLLWLLKWT